MANRTRKSDPAATPASFSVPLFLLLAFALGVGTTWLIMRTGDRAPTPPQIESFLPSPATGAASAPPPAPALGPPNVSKMSPVDAARTLGNWNYDQQNWTHAIEHYEEAITLGADNPDVRTDLGNCYRFLGQPEKALAQYEIAQKQNPLHENSLFNQISLLGDMLHDKGRADAAAREFLERFPQSPQAATVRQRLEAAPPPPAK